MKQTQFFLIQLFIFSAVFFLIPQIASAAMLKFDPATVNTAANGTFQLKVMIDSGADQVLGTDAQIIFDDKLLEAQKIDDGDYFTVGKKTIFPSTATSTARIYIAGVVDDPASSQTGAGTLATITFRAKTNGSGSVTFLCTVGDTADSNIVKDDIHATDIIDCTKNGKADIVIGATTTPEPTIAPSATPRPTATPIVSSGSSSTKTPSSLPKSGIFEELVKFAVPGAILLVLGAGLKFLL